MSLSAAAAAELVVRPTEGSTDEGRTGHRRDDLGTPRVLRHALRAAGRYVLVLTYRDPATREQLAAWGVVFDEALDEEIQVTVIATGINSNTMGIPKNLKQDYRKAPAYSNVVNLREATVEEAEEGWTVKMNGESLDTPTFQRMGSQLSGAEEEPEPPKRKGGLFSKYFLRENLHRRTY